MPNDLSSPFYTSLLELLHRQAAEEAKKEGGDTAWDAHRSMLLQAMSPGAADGPLPLAEIIENHHHLFTDRGAARIDQKLFESFPEKDFSLRIYRGLPRVYNRENPTQNHVKRDFAHLAGLKRLAAEKFLLPLYEKISVAGAKVCLFTWVIGDGWGDLIAAKEMRRILGERFPDLAISQVVLVPKSLSGANPDPSFVYYEKECAPDRLSDEAIGRLKGADLIVSAPTFYPHTKELMEKVGAASRLLCIGEYGYIESSWFHPRSGNRSMGLHFLEKGILIRKPMNANFARIENENILQTLFGTAAPGPMEVEKYLDGHQFYLAYLLSPVGGAVYLHALLHSLRSDARPIDLCTPDLGWFVAYVQKQKREGKPLLEGDFGVASIEVLHEGKSHLATVSENGKRVRIICPGAISDADFRLLVRLSGEFVGVRGNQSFSEAVSANRAFFYDGALHSRYFVKDLLALAENRLAQHRSSLAVFRGMGKAYLHNVPQEEGEWVDETFFQEREPWIDIARKIGSALIDPDALAGFKKFNQLIAEEHAFNRTLCQMVQRELAHRERPELASIEESEAALFCSGKKSIGQFVGAMRGTLEKK